MIGALCSRPFFLDYDLKQTARELYLTKTEEQNAVIERLKGDCEALRRQLKFAQAEIDRLQQTVQQLGPWSLP
jgi:SMC interacting uncharacterized protein involved in chromosome segregation